MSGGSRVSLSGSTVIADTRGRPDSLLDSHSSGYAACMSRVIRSKRARACASVVSGLSRPTRYNPRFPRLVKVRSPLGCTAGIIAIGTQISIESPRIMPVYCGGAMPITVSGCSLSVTVFPMSSGSELKRRCHRLWLIIATGFRRGTTSSSAEKVRPFCAATPKTSK